MHRYMFLVLLFLLSANTEAHQQKEAYITILFNQHTGNIEVSHRFLLHDAEHALSLFVDGPSDLHSNAQTQDRFAAYVKKHFSLSDGNGQRLPLSAVGHEVDGKYFWVYQETLVLNTDELRFRHTALQEVWPSQINQINVEKDGWVRSARLTKANEWHRISLLNAK